MENYGSQIYKERQVNIPDRLPVLYCGGFFIHSSKAGIVLEISQQLAATNTDIVVARIGMGADIAADMADKLQEAVQKHKEMQSK